jgi:hypothetical protein
MESLTKQEIQKQAEIAWSKFKDEMQGLGFPIRSDFEGIFLDAFRQGANYAMNQKANSLK